MVWVRSSYSGSNPFLLTGMRLGCLAKGDARYIFVNRAAAVLPGIAPEKGDSIYMKGPDSWKFYRDQNNGYMIPCQKKLEDTLIKYAETYNALLYKKAGK